MGKARQDRLRIRIRLRDQRPLEVAKLADQEIDFVAQIEADVQRHLVVPAAGGMHARPLRTQHVDQRAFDVHMDVFHRNIVSEIPGFDPAADVVKLGPDRFAGRFRNDSLRRQHFHMRLASLDIMPVKPFVERDRFRIKRDLVARGRTEPAAPERHCNTSCLFPEVSKRYSLLK